MRLNGLWTWFTHRAEERCAADQCESGAYPIASTATTPEPEKERIRARAVLIEEAFRKQVVGTKT